jgi:hypothetical protein
MLGRSSPLPTPSTSSRFDLQSPYFLSVLILLTLCLRFVGMGLRHEFNVPRQIGAEAGAIARNIIDGHGFTSPYDDPATGHHSPSVHLAPLYPYLLAGLMKLGLSHNPLYYTAVAINLLFASLLPAIVLRIGQTLSFPTFVSLAAALGICLCPEAFRAPSLIWDEAVFVTLSAFLILRMLALLQKTVPPGLGTSCGLGLTSGILALLNPAMAVALPLGWLGALRARGYAWSRVGLHAAIFLAALFVASAPWHIRNWFLITPPSPVFIRGGFWITTWSALHPIKRISNPNGTWDYQPLHPWNGTDPMVRMEHGSAITLTEQEFNDWSKARVLAAVREDPWIAVHHVVDQVNSFWLGIAEARRWYKSPWLFFLAQGVPAIGGILGLFGARRHLSRPALVLLCGLLLVYPIPYYLADASARYRHPIDFILCLGCGWLLWLVIRPFGGVKAP